MWNCLCDCGESTIVSSAHLRSGHTTSCGCYKAINMSKLFSKHHMTHSHLYYMWNNMKRRCYTESSSRYKVYGGRGIKVCDEWKDFSTFRDWALSSGYRDDLTIDREDNDGDYTPENCRWTDALHQARNRSTNIDIRIGNSVRCLTEWCEIFDLDYGTVNRRYHDGYDTDKLFKPTQGRYRGNQQDQLTP